VLSKSGLGCCNAQVKGFIQIYGPAAAIQASRNNLPYENENGQKERFLQSLSDALYGGLRASVEDDWEVVVKALTASRPSRLSKDDWEKFRERIGGFSGTSAPGIAEVLAEIVDTEKRPEAIMSFNAETLLFALINCYYGLKNDWTLRDQTVKVLDVLSHDLQTTNRGLIPYYYVHGVLPVPDAQGRFNDSISPEKLIFSEGQYLGLSGSVYSWQSTTFLNQCLHHRCVFIGLSFSDPNLRRWLSWEYESRRRELLRNGLPANRPFHLWLRKRPHERHPKGLLSSEQLLIEKSVEHLGVRVVWLDEWSDIGPRLREMLEDSPE
jgi:hypothetical protein